MFRNEVLQNRSDRLSGNVFIALSVSWQVIGYLIFGGVAATLLFLCLVSFSRVEIAGGTITPDKGVSTILPTRSGTIASISVADGQEVAAGAELAAIRVEEDSALGVSAAAQIQAAVSQQDSSLVAQIAANKSVANAQIYQVAAQKSGLSAEISQLESQISIQREMISSAKDDYDRARIVAERGFISQNDLRSRRDTLLARRQALSQLTQSMAVKRSALIEAKRSAAQLAAQAQAQNASLAASRAQVAQQAANTSGSRSYVLRAPVAGRVTALTARVGQPANPQTSLMTIVPVGSILRAEIAVPSTAIGFIKSGQAVRLAVDAFPYQRFGTVSGRVFTVSTSPVTVQTANGATVSVYPVIVTLDRASISAYGRDEHLVPGMTLTARIIAERQSLFEWLFEPLFAVDRRQ
jgi:membrane fusion protein